MPVAETEDGEGSEPRRSTSSSCTPPSIPNTPGVTVAITRETTVLSVWSSWLVGQFEEPGV